ncbi:MAG: mechanosensitive ion channel family protein [Planctomycetota bacterium JB042]
MIAWSRVLFPVLSWFVGVGIASAQGVAEVPIAELRSDLERLDGAALEAKATAHRAALEAAAERVDAIEEELAAATEEKKAELETELSAQRATVAAVVKRYALVVDALDAAGGEVKEHQQALFEATNDPQYLGASAAFDLAGKWVKRGKEWLIEDAPGVAIKVVVCILLLIVFKILGRTAGRLTRKALSRSHLKASELLKNFAENVVRKLVFLLGLLIVLSTLGVPIGPFLAGVGVLGFVVGFALQDTLNNFAAGVMLLLYRPYDVGDFVTAGGVTGKVQAMTLVSTTMLTPDNQVNVVPNGRIWGDVITNVTANATRRVDLKIGVGYQDDVDEVERVILDVVKAHDKVLAEPAPVVKVGALGESSVDFLVRPWSKTVDYWDVYWDLTKALKKRFDAEGISIPYPQRDLHVVSNEAGIGGKGDASG